MCGFVGFDYCQRQRFTCLCQTVSLAFCMKTNRNATAGLLLVYLVLCAAMAGCSTYGRARSPTFEVAVSFRDYVSLTYHSAESRAATDSPALVRIELSGSGHVHYARGRSRRVHDPFWKQRDDQHWDDIFTDQLVLGEDEAQALLQALVDAGVFKREMQGPHITDAHRAYVFVQARINERRGIVITDAPAFTDIYHKLAARFEGR